MTDALPKLDSNNFSVLNKEGSPVIYRTDDPSVNVLTLSFINNTGNELLLKAGEPARPTLKASSLSSETGSTFSFDFQSMMSSGTMESLVIGLPSNWKAVFSPATQNYPPTWSLVPKADITVKVKDRIDFVIQKITCKQTQGAKVELLYSNVPGFRNIFYPYVFHLEVANLPSKEMPLAVGYTDAVQLRNVAASPKVPAIRPVPVYINYNQTTPIKNGFTLLLTNTSAAPLVPGGIIGKPVLPDLTILFLFGSEYYHITTQEIADNNKLGIDVSSASWTSEEHTPSTSYWRFTPHSQEVMAPNETVQFPIHNIITPLRVKPGDISVMYIRFNNVAGYADARVTLLLEKRKAVAAIKSFSVKKISGKAKLTWETTMASQVTLHYWDRDGKKILLDSKNGDIGFENTDFEPTTAPTAERTVFILTAYGDNETDTRWCEMTVDQPMAVIRSFTSTPSLIEAGKSTRVRITWEVENAVGVTLETPNGNTERVAGRGYKDIVVTEASKLYLRAHAYGTTHAEPAVSQITIYAYKKEKIFTAPDGIQSPIAQSRPTVIVNERKSLLHVSYAAKLKNGSFALQMTSSTASAIDGTNKISLSQDGTRLFSYASQIPSPLKMLNLDTNEVAYSSNLGYVLTVLPTPDNMKVYCACAYPDTSTNVKVLNIVKENNRYSLQDGPDIRISGSIRQARLVPMILSPDATKLYILNSEEAIICVVNVSDDSPVNTISLDSPKARGATSLVFANGNLYVSCVNSNSVAVANPLSRRQSSFIIDNIESQPGNMVVSPDGRYVYVANFGSNSVSAIDTTTNRVTSVFKVGMSPLGMAIDKSGNSLFVANYCDRTVSVVDLATNVVLTPALTTGDGSNPFDIATYTDEKGYTRIYVAKENYPQRAGCSNRTNNNMDGVVYGFKRPTPRN